MNAGPQPEPEPKWPPLWAIVGALLWPAIWCGGLIYASIRDRPEPPPIQTMTYANEWRQLPLTSEAPTVEEIREADELRWNMACYHTPVPPPDARPCQSAFEAY
jgi:hypothetical protein